MVLLITQYISFGLLLNHFTFITFLGFGISFVSFLSIDLVYNALPGVCPTLEYWSMQNMSYQVLVYLNILICVVISILPRLIYLLYKITFDKDELQKYREDNKIQTSSCLNKNL